MSKTSKKVGLLKSSITIAIITDLLTCLRNEAHQRVRVAKTLEEFDLPSRIRNAADELKALLLEHNETLTEGGASK